MIERIPISLQKSDLVIPVCHEGFNRSQIMLQAVKAVLRAHFDKTQIEPISVLFLTRFLVILCRLVMAARADLTRRTPLRSLRLRTGIGKIPPIFVIE